MKMKIRHISDLKYIAGGIPALAAGVLLVLSAGFSSCSEQIEIEGNLDASSIENATAVHGFLNVLDNPRLKVTEVRTEPVMWLSTILSTELISPCFLQPMSLLRTTERLP